MTEQRYCHCKHAADLAPEGGECDCFCEVCGRETWRKNYDSRPICEDCGEDHW